MARREVSTNPNLLLISSPTINKFVHIFVEMSTLLLMLMKDNP